MPIFLLLPKEGDMLDILSLWRKSRLKTLIRTNKALEKQIDLQANLNELLKEENEIQQEQAKTNQ